MGKQRKNSNKGHVENDNKGTPTPPTTHTQQLLPPSQSALSANSAVFTPTSSLLSQARDAMYPQNTQDTQTREINSNIIRQFLPEQNITAQGCPNTSYNRGNPTYVPQLVLPVNDQQQQQQHQQQQQQQQQQQYLISAHSNINQPSVSMTSASEPGNQSSAFSDAPPWVAHMLNSFDTRLQQIEKQLASQNTNWHNINLTLQNQNARMSHLEDQMAVLNSVKQNVEKCEMSISIMSRDVNLTNQKIDSYDESIKVYSGICDDLKSDQSYTDSAINELFKRVEHLENEQTKLKSNATESANAITDLQCRSMRDNLIFTGIEEPELSQSEFEDTEKTLCDFLANEMNIGKQIPFHRVHRIGNSTHRNDSPRQIVAKFEHFKDREEVRFAAPKTLKGKPYGVREQFPKVVEDKRKVLYPEMKKARSDSQNKVRLVRDRLYINNIEFIPDGSANPQNKPNRDQMLYRSDRRDVQRERPHSSVSTYSNAVRNNDGVRNIGYGKSRYIYPRPQSRNVSFTKQQNTNKKSNSFEVTISNKFTNLLSEEDNTGQNMTFESKKHKASSPLDYEKTFKKHRENANSDQESSTSDTSYIEVDKSPQSDPPQTQGRTLSQLSIPTMELPSKSIKCGNVNLRTDSNQANRQREISQPVKQNTIEKAKTVTPAVVSSENSRTTTQRENENQSCDQTINQA